MGSGIWIWCCHVLFADRRNTSLLIIFVIAKAIFTFSKLCIKPKMGETSCLILAEITVEEPLRLQGWIGDLQRRVLGVFGGYS